MQRPSDPKVTIRIPNDLLAELDAEARRERYDRDKRDGHGTRSAIIRRALQIYFHHRMF